MKTEGVAVAVGNAGFHAGTSESSIVFSRLMSILHGVGAALTLDEFALWLNLRDAYWSREGRSSTDASILFGALLAAGAWGAPLLRRGRKHKQPEPLK
jgi:hypothetical protein